MVGRSNYSALCSIRQRLSLLLIKAASHDPPEGGASGEPRRQSEQRTEGAQRMRTTFTNIRTGDDSCQFIVSTTGDAIDARDVVSGSRTSHGMGQMSDETIQQLSRCNRQSTVDQPMQQEEIASPSFGGIGRSLAQ